MKELNIGVGKSLQQELCAQCKKMLEDKLKRRHVLAAVTPKGMKKLIKLIDNNVCSACNVKILKAGAKNK